MNICSYAEANESWKHRDAPLDDYIIGHCMALGAVCVYTHDLDYCLEHQTLNSKVIVWPNKGATIRKTLDCCKKT